VASMGLVLYSQGWDLVFQHKSGIDQLLMHRVVHWWCWLIGDAGVVRSVAPLVRVLGDVVLNCQLFLGQRLHCMGGVECNPCVLGRWG